MDEKEIIIKDNNINKKYQLMNLNQLIINFENDKNKFMFVLCLTLKKQTDKLWFKASKETIYSSDLFDENNIITLNDNPISLVQGLQKHLQKKNSIQVLVQITNNNIIKSINIH